MKDSIWNLFGQPEDAGNKQPSPLWNLFGTGGDIAEAAAIQAEIVEEPCASKFDERMVFWAMRNIPASEATKHFLICGATGSGKSVNIQLFLQSIASRFRPDNSTAEQLILFDAKYDAIPMLAALGLKLPDPENPTPADHPNIWLINPYDRRSAEWNLSEITNTPTMARHVATLLIPEERHASAGSRFFTDSSRELVLATIIALGNIAGGEWTLRDLLCALSSRQSIASVTAQHPRAKELAARILDDERHSPGVLSSIGSKLGQYEQIAALWHSQRQKKVFSIAEFLKKPGVLILGNDPVLRESLWPINAILLKSLTSEILRGADTLQPRHWFVLDEFRAMERLDCMPDLLNRGRSKGSSVLIGLQGIEGLEDQEVYGRAKTQEMLGQCGYKTFLRVGGPSTAEWAERLFGRTRYMETSYSDSWNHKGEHSHSASHNVSDRTAILASTFLNLPFPVVNGPFESINDVPCLGSTITVRRPFNLLLGWQASKDPHVKSLEPRDSIFEQTFLPWDEEEHRFFHGKPPKSSSAGESPESGGTNKSKGRKSKTKKVRKLPKRENR